jgi:RNA polymerase sigma-70 factor (ECF subfamily)
MTDSPARPNSMSRDPKVPARRPVDLAEIYRSEFAYVWKTLRRLGAPPPDLDDLAHEVFVVVHRHLGDYDAARPLRPWLFGIALRVVADFRRLGRNQNEIPGTRLEPEDHGPDPLQQLEAGEARELLMMALATLDLERRAVFVMHEIDETTMPEIASVLGIPLNTAYSRLRLARAGLAAFLERFRPTAGRRHA